MAKHHALNKFDPIALIEAAYQLDLSERSWLESLASKLRPKIGANAEIVAGTFLLDGPCTRYGSRVGIDIPDHFMDASAANLENGLMLEGLFGGPKGFFKLGEREPLLLQYLRRDLPRLIESVGVIARRSSQEGVFISTHTSCDRQANYREKYLYDRLIPHIEAGYRLRENFSSNREEVIEAVLSPSGACLYAHGPARNRVVRDQLRQMVKNRDRARSSLRDSCPEEALELWSSLILSRWTLLDQFDEDGKRFVVAVKNPEQIDDPRQLTDKERAVINEASLGRTSDEIAFTLGIGASTVRVHLGRALRKMCIRRRSDLIALRRAKLRLEPCSQLPDIAVAQARSDETYSKLSITRAEQEVLDLIVEGASNAKIAETRCVAVRTVANQVASLLRKFEVSDRESLAATTHALVSLH